MKAKRSAGLRASGFTLIELMIVVAIIGILAAVAIPKFAALIRQSSEGACRGNLGAIRSALSIYYGDLQGSYPDDMTSLTIGAKYMSSLPQAKTPPYHADSSAVTNQSAGDAVDDTTGWSYNNIITATNLGNAYVSCTHTDTRGSNWSSY